MKYLKRRHRADKTSEGTQYFPILAGQQQAAASSAAKPVKARP